MRTSSYTSYAALHLRCDEGLGGKNENRKEKLWIKGSHICNFAASKRANQLKSDAIRGLLRFSGDVSSLRIRRLEEIRLDSLFDLTDIKKRWRLGSSLFDSCAAFYDLGRNKEVNPLVRRPEDARFGRGKHLVAVFSYVADGNESEAGCENKFELCNGQYLHEEPQCVQKELHILSLRVGRALLLLFGGTVFFLLCAGFRPKLALAQQSTIPAPSSVSDASQDQAPTAQENSIALETKDTAKESTDEKTSSSKHVFSEKAPTVERKFEPKDQQAFLEAYAERYPTDMMAQRALLRLYMSKGEVKSAVKVLDKLLSFEPDNIEWKYLKAQTYDFSGDAKAAREAFEELYKLQPLSARILQGLAISMQKMGEDPTAIVEMLKNAANEAITEKKTKEARNLHMLLGQMLTLEGKLGDALKVYKQMEEEDPQDFRPYLCQGLVYSILGKTKEAEKYFRHYRELCPADFPNRGFLDDLMLKSKTAVRKFEEFQRKEQGAGSKSLKSKRPMKQPNIYGSGPTDGE